MPDKPAAEVAIDEALVRHLVVSQAREDVPDAATRTLAKVAEGWDSEVWRLGADLAVRLPRRQLAAPLVLHEQRSLPLIGPAIAAVGIAVPTPLVCGTPDERYPWAWSVVPWIDGTRGIDVPRPARAGWASPLASALAALHVDAPADHPVNPVRGVPLASRGPAFEDRVNGLEAAQTIASGESRLLHEAWASGLAAPSWDGPAVWIHGDLHPGNLVASGASLTGIIDFGDVTAGDPAYDLAVAWLAFDNAGRGSFVAATAARYDDATWTRAYAWAAAVVAMLLAHSDDEPAYAGLGRDALEELAAGSP